LHSSANWQNKQMQPDVDDTATGDSAVGAQTYEDVGADHGLCSEGSYAKRVRRPGREGPGHLVCLSAQPADVFCFFLRAKKWQGVEETLSPISVEVMLNGIAGGHTA
jgi:hypothetical protein